MSKETAAYIELALGITAFALTWYWFGIRIAIIVFLTMLAQDMLIIRALKELAYIMAKYTKR